MENEEKNKQYLAAGFIGLFLISIVALITVFRSNSFREKKPAEIKTSNYGQENSRIDERSITAKELMQKIIQKEELVILDIRVEIDYKKEHLVDSLNIPFTDFQKASASLQKEKKYIILDDGDDQSSILALQMLAENNILNTLYLRGGFLAWKEQYNPTISSGDPDSFVDQAKVRYIKSDKLKELLSQNFKLQIIYLGSAETFKLGHIPGAQNIPLDDLEKEKSQLSLAKQIILYDDGGLGAFMGAVRMYDMGFFNVLSLSDGLDGWKNNKFELVK